MLRPLAVVQPRPHLIQVPACYSAAALDERAARLAHRARSEWTVHLASNLGSPWADR